MLDQRAGALRDARKILHGTGLIELAGRHMRARPDVLDHHERVASDVAIAYNLIADAHQGDGRAAADVFERTARFNREVIGIPFPEQPTRLRPERKSWTCTAIREEVQELEDAETVEDEADALFDAIYFAAGRIYEMGIDPRTAAICFELIDAANMQKRRGELSKRPNSLGYDAVKPDGWTAPDLSKALRPRTSVEAYAHVPLPFDHDQAMDRVNRHQVASDQVMDRVNRHQVALEQSFAEGGMAMGSGLQITELPVRLTSDSIDAGRVTGWADLDSCERPKVILLGYARHGKDTVAEMLRDHYGYQFRSSSEFCAEHVVWPWFNDPKNGYVPYETVQQCYEDRGSHRALWYDLITAYNTPDLSRLGREIFRDNDVYVGMRNKRELWANQLRGTADYVIWVDASDRLPPEDKSSCTVEPWMADFVLDNSGSLSDLRGNLRVLMEGLGVHPTAVDLPEAP